MQDFGEDAEVLRGLIAGDRQVFDVLYRRHNAPMLRLATAILGVRASAEEVAQDTWVSVLRNIAAFEGRSSLAGWIFTILTNKARTRAQRDGRMLSFDAGGEEDSLAAAFDGRGRWRDMPELWDQVTPERIVEGRDMMDHVNRAIEALPAAQRAVLILRGQQGLDPAEVCKALGITEGNMRVLLHRARTTLRGALGRILA
ncbi:MAG: sigma-70 family RNA polymerase sigma factor [Paracoccaceae bacterium]|nr:sigma-70 family RNA polymerase sigma factor [Paracoccaceae bacterium]